MLLFSLFQSPHIIQHTNSWLRAEYMIAEGDDAFGGKVVIEGIDQEICFEQNAIIEAGYTYKYDDEQWASRFFLSAWRIATITGTVFNKTTSEPLDFATVVLVKPETGAPLPIGITTDENGVFIIPNAPSGKYIVRVSMIGNVTQERE